MSKRTREDEIHRRLREARPPGAVVRHYRPGEAPLSFTAGDFSLHRATTNRAAGGATTLLGRLIQAGERQRYGNTDPARWTHAALIVSQDGDLCEALETGVSRTNIEKYRGTDYMIVHPVGTPEQRQLACGFAETRVGDRYGILNFLGLAVQALFGWNLSVHMDGQFICSGLVARATEKYIVAYPRSPENMMPADLAYYWGAQSGEPEPALGWFGRMLNLLASLVGLFRSHRGDPAPDPGHPPQTAAPSGPEGIEEEAGAAPATAAHPPPAIRD